MNNSAATALSPARGGRCVSDLVPEVGSARAPSLRTLGPVFLGCMHVILRRGAAQDVNFGWRFGAARGRSRSTCSFEYDELSVSGALQAGAGWLTSGRSRQRGCRGCPDGRRAGRRGGRVQDNRGSPSPAPGQLPGDRLVGGGGGGQNGQGCGLGPPGYSAVVLRLQTRK